MAAPEMQMAEDRMPEGQAPVPHKPQQEQRREAKPPPQTAMQRAAAERAERMEEMAKALDKHRAKIEPSLLAQKIPFDVFKAATIIGLKNTLKNDAAFFEKVSVASYFEAVQRAVKDGLLPDGKQAAITRFANEAAYMPMIEGYCKILFDARIAQSINHNVVLATDHFEFMEGSDPWVEHRPDLNADPDDPEADIIAAWCFVTTVDGGKFLEVSRKKTLERVARVSRAEKGPRKDWAGEMHRKTPFRRLVKRLPKHPRLDSLIEHEDMNVDLERPAAPETPEERRRSAARTMSNADLLSDDRGALPAPDPEEVVDLIDEGAADPRDAEENAEVEDQTVAIQVTTDIRATSDVSVLATLRQEWEASDAFKAASEETRSWVNEAFSRRADEVSGMDPGPQPLRAIISSTQKEPKVYEDPALWKADILTKLSSLTVEQAGAYWKRNAEFIHAADGTGLEEAQSLMQTFAAKGVNVGRHD